MLRLACLFPLLTFAADPIAEIRGSATQISAVVSQPAAEGMYVVTVAFGASDIASVTTVKAEARRLLALNVAVPRVGR